MSVTWLLGKFCSAFFVCVCIWRIISVTCCFLEILVFSVVDFFFFFSSRRRHTRSTRDWSSDVCSSDLTWRLELSCPLSAGSLASRTCARSFLSHASPPLAGRSLPVHRGRRRRRPPRRARCDRPARPRGRDRVPPHGRSRRRSG